MQSSLFEPGRPQHCPSYSRRRDRINSGLLRSLDRGGGGGGTYGTFSLADPIFLVRPCHSRLWRHTSDLSPLGVGSKAEVQSAIPTSVVSSSEPRYCCAQDNEKEDFLDWRRGMAQIEEDEGVVMTPFEKNLEVWRQLWRVIERSDVVFIILDSRNPLMFRNQSLEVRCSALPLSPSLPLPNWPDGGRRAPGGGLPDSLSSYSPSSQ